MGDSPPFTRPKPVVVFSQLVERASGSRVYIQINTAREKLQMRYQQERRKQERCRVVGDQEEDE